MRYILAILFSLFSIGLAQAQAPTRLCFSLVNGFTNNCVPVDNENPLPVNIVTGGGSIAPYKFSSAGTQQNGLAIGTNTTLTVPAGTICAYITIEGGVNVRRTSDGTSATTTNGTLLMAGAQWGDCGPLASYKFTAVSGSPIFDVEYFK